MPNNDDITEARKGHHIDVALHKPVEYIGKSAGFEDIEFVHKAVPETDFTKIDISTKFLDKHLKAPFMICAITGGTERAKRYNLELAKAAQASGIIMGVGSQRAMIENPLLAPTYRVRDVAPDVFIVGNFGIAQVREYGSMKIADALEKIGADAVAIHFNALQEIMQKEGDRNFEGSLKEFEKFCSECSLPVIAKETGAGINGKMAAALSKAGADAIDVSGAGGTSWAAVEILRNRDRNSNVDDTVYGSPMFWDWGIPTTVCIAEVAERVRPPIIASGGVRSGLDVAKAIALGANIGGAALPFLKIVDTGGATKLKETLDDWAEQMKIAMFLAGCKDLRQLSKTQLIITGRTAELMHAYGLDIAEFAKR